MKHKKGQAGIYVYWFFLAIIIVVLAGLFAPMGVLFSTKMLTAGESILSDAQGDLSQIQDGEVRETLNASLSAAIQSNVDNIEVHADIFRYSWIIMLILSAIVAFLYTRQLVEYNGGGFIG